MGLAGTARPLDWRSELPIDRGGPQGSSRFFYARAEALSRSPARIWLRLVRRDRTWRDGRRPQNTGLAPIACHRRERSSWGLALYGDGDCVTQAHEWPPSALAGDAQVLLEGVEALLGLACLAVVVG